MRISCKKLLSCCGRVDLSKVVELHLRGAELVENGCNYYVNVSNMYVRMHNNLETRGGG